MPESTREDVAVTLHYPLSRKPKTGAVPRSVPAAITPDQDPIIRIAQMLEAISTPLTRYLEHHGAIKPPKTPQCLTEEQALAKSPLAPYLKDDSITDVLVNGINDIFICRDAKLEKIDAAFSSEEELHTLAETIAQAIGRSIDPQRPLVDACLKDGSRVNIIAPPMAVNGLTMSIRKFPHQEITLETLVENESMTQQLADFLKLCARSRVSILVSGGTGTGKTTMLNAISHHIPPAERIITIEDTAELRLQQPHVVRLETKEPPIIGQRYEEVNTCDLVRNALRMRPDRIIVGEVRGAEVYDMVQAMNTGHAGSMTTLHANAPRDALTRLENLLAPVMQNTPTVSIRRQLVSALNLIIQLGYAKNGKRIVTSVTDVIGMEGDIPTMQEIFTLKENGTTTQVWTGILPRNTTLAEMVRGENLFPPRADLNNIKLT